jgi:hypothetical protein
MGVVVSFSHLYSGERIPCIFTPGERALGSLFVGVWVGPGAGLDSVAKGIHAPAGNRTPVVKPVAQSLY